MSVPSLWELTRVSARIGILSFGGPAAQIALMHKELVEDRDWLDEQSFLRALSLCMLLPGPEAMQLATYAGWRLHGVLGGVISGLLFVLPGAAIILALAMGYAIYGQLDLVQAAFVGIKAAVSVIVLQALLKVSRKALTAPDAWVIAALAFVSIFAFALPFPLIIAAAALWGYLNAKPTALPPPETTTAAPQSVKTILVWGTLWLAPLAGLVAFGDGFLTQIGLFFAKLAVVTFGGAYAVLAYMTQTIVSDYGWITTAQMIDALGLAETTPGPLILVTEFVALLAGFNRGGTGLALAAGGIALWVTFMPCFLWIFLAGPYLDQIARKPRLSHALNAITAAVVGVILNLSLWFALHVLFGTVSQTLIGPLSVPIPALDTFQPVAAGFTVLAAVLLLYFQFGMVRVLAGMALISAGILIL
jgi:chromate transporter